MMTDTLRGLSFMHGMDSGPIAHGDIKSSNILVNSDETALICDFGRSCQQNDSPNEVILSSSSPFGGTVRYMSPELLVPDTARPSPAADMWAYGCVALEKRASSELSAQRSTGEPNQRHAVEGALLMLASTGLAANGASVPRRAESDVT
ncbi:hypothetical protein FRC11_013966 [Ceratobasidium sp. 423]|nr:hypothetical protein FRC11_013966 [Ceratobasidium sp. 423]